MAVTITQESGGGRAARWIVTFGADSDTLATIPHGFNGVPDDVYFTPLNTETYVGQVARTPAPDAQNIYLTKNTVAGSGGASVELVGYVPHSSF